MGAVECDCGSVTAMPDGEHASEKQTKIYTRPSSYSPVKFNDTEVCCAFVMYPGSVPLRLVTMSPFDHPSAHHRHGW